MKKNLIKYIIVFFLFLTSIYALEEQLISDTKKLNRVDGKKDVIDSIKKDFKVIKKKVKLMPLVNPDDLNSYDTKLKRVKLIDVVLESLSNSDLLKSKKENVIKYEIKVNNAISEFYPKLDYEYSYGRTVTEPSGTPGKRFKFYNNKSYKISLKQNLFSGGGDYFNLKSVQKKLEVAKNQYKIALEDNIKKTLGVYFEVAFNHRAIMVNERNMEVLKKILEIVTIKYENGAASISDLESIKANVASAKTKLVNIKSKLFEALQEYEYLVGDNLKNTLPYEKFFDINISTPDKLYERALNNNRDLINYYESIKAEILNEKKAKAAFKPEVDFELSYKKKIDAEDLQITEDDLVGTLKFKYNIYNANKDNNKVLEVHSTIRDLRYRLSNEKRKIKWNLNKYYNAVKSSNDALESTKEEILASRKMVSSHWDMFKLGEQDLNTLLLGQRQLNSAETNLVEYEEKYAKDIFRIFMLTGDLLSYFDVDPENPKFVDFSNSNYKNTILAKDGDELLIDEIKDLEKKEKVKEVELAQPSINENINNYLKDFSSFDDESYMIEISSFSNIYDTYEFIKDNDLSKNSFTYDTLENLNVETKIVHNNFDNFDKTFLGTNTFV